MKGGREKEGRMEEEGGMKEGRENKSKRKGGRFQFRTYTN